MAVGKTTPRRKKATRKKLHVRHATHQRANSCRYKYGQDHPKAKLSDRDVELILELRSEGWSYTVLSVTFDGTPRSTIRDICKGLTRYRCG